MSEQLRHAEWQPKTSYIESVFMNDPSRICMRLPRLSYASFSKIMTTTGIALGCLHPGIAN